MKFVVVLPFFNEQDVVIEFISQLSHELKLTSHSFVLLAIDDGSRDNTVSLLKQAMPSDETFTSYLIRLEQNYGHERALQAGFEFATTNFDFDGLISMDTDLQDSPTTLARMIEIFSQNGVSTFARSIDRDDRISKRLFANLYYRIQSYLTSAPEFSQVRNFFVLPKQVVLAISRTPGHFQSTRINAIELVRLNSQFIDFRRDSRFAGSTHYKFSDSYHLALDGLFSQPRKFLSLIEKFTISLCTTTILLSFYVIFQRVAGTGVTLPGVPFGILVSLITLSATLFLNYFVLSILVRVMTFTRNLPGYIVSAVEEIGE
jgi:glycosyltransferase involved in cell wall biosynthesis